MRRTLLALLWLFACPVVALAQFTINEQPMYNGQVKSEALLVTDQKFIAAVVQQFGGRSVAAQAYVNFGWGYLNAGNPAIAIKRFNQAWLLDSTAADVYFGFSAYLHQQGKSQEAERFMGMGQQRDVQNQSLLRYYGSLAVGKEVRKDYAGAIALYSQILQADANCSFAISKLGFIYQEQQDTARANQYLTRAIHLNSQDSVSYLNRGWLRYEQKRYPGAIADFTQAIRINPHYFTAYTDAGNPNAALLDWQKCLNLVLPRNRGDFYCFIAQTKLRAGDTKGACEAFHQALQWGTAPAAERETRRLVKVNCK